jgi:ABC-type multidrug transport system fused ATPase/permease subunit
MTRSLRLLGPFLRKHWSALGGAAASTVAVTAAELAQPWPLKLVLDSLLGGHRQRPFAPGVRDLALLAAVAGLVLAIALVDAYASFAGDFWLKRAGALIVHDLRVALYAHLQRLALATCSRNRSGRWPARASCWPGCWPSASASTRRWRWWRSWSRRSSPWPRSASAAG